MDTFIWHALPMPFTSLHQNSDPNYLPKVDAIGWFDKTVVSLGSLGLVSALHQGEHLGEFRWRPQPWWLTLQFLGWAYSAAGLNPCQPANVKPQDTSLGIDCPFHTLPRVSTWYSWCFLWHRNSASSRRMSASTQKTAGGLVVGSFRVGPYMAMVRHLSISSKAVDAPQRPAQHGANRLKQMCPTLQEPGHRLSAWCCMSHL